MTVIDAFNIYRSIFLSFLLTMNKELFQDIFNKYV